MDPSAQLPQSGPLVQGMHGHKHTVKHQRRPKRGGEYPLPIWWHIGLSLTSARDLCRLARCNKTMWSLFSFERAAFEARLYREISAALPSFHLFTAPRSSCVERAIRARYPIPDLERLILGCNAVSDTYLHGMEIEWGDTQPALFVAAEIGHLDAMECLLKNGTPINLRFGDQMHCYEVGHTHCYHLAGDCRNALCVAREAGREDVERFLLERGIEDNCGSQCAGRHDLEDDV
ncbi:uncharacterized protein GGS25DRAFT_517639 [Hypoxylon fragiforme]|uniref:uncharacterized protein n=1 Tax=Hypoxylon fragiforme TaxID=63214 RepID=UPI0020C649B9|nr:uncharacterized protein GGS25DRAFT_517639 [Hypoxylon fragiforme]KAI2614783.1 hypothetical protein GGS25DRAFT_517639 [Hypoxylon fragiforme]